MVWAILILALIIFFWWAWDGGSISGTSLKERGAIPLPQPASASKEEKTEPEGESSPPPAASLKEDLPAVTKPGPEEGAAPLPKEDSPVSKTPLSEKEKSLKETGPDLPPLPTLKTKGGGKPMLQYARSFNLLEGRPRIGLILMGLGPHRDLTRRAIYELPAEVTLAFAPYTRDLSKIMKEAREFGHEVMIMLPLEPENRQQRDPGPYTLLTREGEGKNKERLEYVLGKGSEMVGVLGFMGARFVKSKEHMEPILCSLWEKGYVYAGGNLSVEDVTSQIAAEKKGAFILVDRSLDMEVSGMSLEAQLADLESALTGKKQIVATSYLYPGTLDKLKPWISSLKEKKIVLASATACERPQVPKGVAPLK
jgi:hypothetical protein